MAHLSDIVCAGCLRRDRKIELLGDVRKKQIFHQLVWEITSSNSAEDVYLCWECEALVRRFMKFKLQVQKSFKVLKDFEQSTPLEIRPNISIQKQFHINYIPNKIQEDITSRFKIQNQFIINYKPNNKDEDFITQFEFDVIKAEPIDFIEPKPSLDSGFEEKVLNSPERNSDNHSFDEEDDELLIDLRKKKKKRMVKKNKVKKKSLFTKKQNFYEIELTAEEIEEERRSQEIREDYVNALFRCEKCIISFPNADDLSDHINVKHLLNASSYKCSICTRSYASELALRYHSGRHRRRWQCRACPARHASARAAHKHYDLLHCTRTDLEHFNNRNSNGNSNRDKTLNGSVKEDLETYPCESCNKVFKWKTSLRKHAEAHRIEAGQKRRPYCDICSLAFTTTANLQKHVKTSSKHQIQLKLRKLKDTAPHDASNVDKQEADIEEIKSIINKDRQLFPCEICDKKFQWRGNLLRHLHNHAARAKGELVCKPCNRTFSSIATYKQHMKISKKHVSENDFAHVCNECGKKFVNKTRLKDHVDWEHLRNFVHKCTHCQKVFKSHTSLYLHKQVVHKKGIAHLCDHCGKSFPNRTKLRGHIIAVHTVEAPYACSACNARFSWHSCLSRHVRRVHHGHDKKTET